MFHLVLVAFVAALAGVSVAPAAQQHVPRAFAPTFETFAEGPFLPAYFGSVLGGSAVVLANDHFRFAPGFECSGSFLCPDSDNFFWTTFSELAATPTTTQATAVEAAIPSPTTTPVPAVPSPSSPFPVVTFCARLVTTIASDLFFLAVAAVRITFLICSVVLPGFVTVVYLVFCAEYRTWLFEQLSVFPVPLVPSADNSLDLPLGDSTSTVPEAPAPAIAETVPATDTGSERKKKCRPGPRARRRQAASRAAEAAAKQAQSS